MYMIIHPDEEDKLMDDGLLSPTDDEGFRLLHKRLLHRLSNEEYGDMPLDVHYSDPDSVHCFSRIPSHLPSVAALEYIGFTTETSACLFHSLWGRSGHHDMMRLWQAVVEHVKEGRLLRKMYGWQHMIEWQGAMDQVGISEELQDCMLDPEWESHWRQENDLEGLAIQTVQMRIVALQAIMSRSFLRVLCGECGHTADARGRVLYPQDLVGAETLPRGRRPLCGVTRHRADARQKKRKLQLLLADRGASVSMYRMLDLLELQMRLGLPPEVFPPKTLGTPSFTAGASILLYSHPEYVHDCISYAKHRAPDLPAYLLREDISVDSLLSIPPSQHTLAPWPSPAWRAHVVRVALDNRTLRMHPEQRPPGQVAMLVEGDKAMRWPVNMLWLVHEEFGDAIDFKFNQAQPGDIIEYSWKMDEGEEFLRRHAQSEATLVRHERHSRKPLDWGHRRLEDHGHHHMLDTE
ncbi:hypothetical protein ESCO_005940 [Escovopsis weberi]|uniref:Uncharacterized protein n=1 Tax=Escovopsis weberi TaxID=150374 RepID=A0A0M8MYP1_ESCWE|nr:hypothetical protein ESCO_005940 [Escovopsis weberi]